VRLRRAPGELKPCRFRPIDLLTEAVTAVARRPGRTALTSLGTTLGAGALVAVAGLGQTVSHQISSRFDARRATEVVVVDTLPASHELAFDEASLARLRGLNGVQAAGELWQVAEGLPVSSTLLGPTEATPVYAADPGALRALGVQVSQGRVYGGFHERQADRVAVLGRVAALRLGISDLTRQPALFLDGSPYVVLGIAEDVAHRPHTLTAVFIPSGAARSGFPPSDHAHEVQIETTPGAGQLIARQAPLALLPEDPERLQAQAPPDPKELRRSVQGDMNKMVALLGGVALLAGMITIASSSLTAVLERTAEIGLRRATGARPRDIAGQFIIEAMTTGLLGGVVGAAVGCAVIAAVALSQRWVAVVDPRLPLLAPAAGVITGTLAGLLPGLRASRIPPVDALRR
jgi:putative ABC transport system permease protein